MTEGPTRSPQPPQGEGGEQTGFQLGGLLAPFLEAGLHDEAREIVAIFLEAYEVCAADIRATLETEDLDACANAAHSLIGSAGGIGAGELAQCLARLEKACRGGDLAGVESLWVFLKEEEDRVLPALRRYLAKGAEIS